MMNAVQPEYFTVGPIPSGGTFVYNGVLVQSDGVTPIAAGMLQTLKLTFIDIDSGSVINSRDAQDVLNLNGVTVDVSGGTGALQWIGGAADSPFVRVSPEPSLGDVEKHLAVFEWTWVENSITYPGKRKLFITVENYQDIDKSSTGDGPLSYSDYVYGPDGLTPVDDAVVWVTSDPGGTTLVAGPQRTTPTGQFEFLLSAGSYYLWVNSPSFQPSAGTAFTV